ncbi:hypothetical protein [Paraburkholderia pallida]|uniref:Uncharacterized protein n=1 Tax=Paraburkholderia pallida TaxID=2547399 RepID=A0A4P7CZG7_9BURK|nr:hypothetical protein [Paraburkholderia pallida]QBQ99644.1 hypothetical protein E1956_21045 [Paraburkholderia pallida]
MVDTLEENRLKWPLCGIYVARESSPPQGRRLSRPDAQSGAVEVRKPAENEKDAHAARLCAGNESDKPRAMRRGTDRENEKNYSPIGNAACRIVRSAPRSR